MRASSLFFAMILSLGPVAPVAAAPCPVGTKILIDNGQPGYAETGNDWATWAGGGQSIGKDYRYLSHTVGGSDRKGTAKWTPTLPVAGLYKISAIFRATENRTPDADYFVHDAAGKSHHYSIDQRDGAKPGTAHGPVYKSLGSHELAPGKGHVVLDGTDDNYSDEADAVLFVLVSCGTTPPPPPGPCDKIAQNAAYELCKQTASSCAGVFTNGAGCTAYCAAAGMVCVKRFGGDKNCVKEPQNPIPCGAVNNNKTDWCECGLPPKLDAGVPPDAKVVADAKVQVDAKVKADAGVQVDAKLQVDQGQGKDQGVQPTPDSGVAGDGASQQDARPDDATVGGCAVAGADAAGPVLIILFGLLGLRCCRRRKVRA